MKTKLLLIAVIIILNANSIISQNFFPLSAGNQWQFKVTTWDPSQSFTSIDTITIKVLKDTVLSNHKNYYKLDGYFPLGGILRSDSSGIYYFNSADSSDCLVYNYNSPIYGPYKTGYQAGGDSAIVILGQIDTSTVFTKEVKSLSFSYNWMIGHNIKFGDSIGPIEYHTSDASTHYDYELIGCKINDKIYGNITNVKRNDIKLDNYTLYQNYPNPFNPSTTISFYIPSGQIVELDIYDILGKGIAMLLNKFMQSGRYNVEFNCANLPSGIYFYRLKTENIIITKKMIILK